MKFDWKKALTTAAVLAFGTMVAILCNKDGDEDVFSNWLESASDDELSDGYEQRRQEWARTGFGGNGEKILKWSKLIKKCANGLQKNGKMILAVTQIRTFDGLMQIVGIEINPPYTVPQDNFAPCLKL